MKELSQDSSFFNFCFNNQRRFNMDFFKLVSETRSCRRFQQKPLPDGFLESLVDLARRCPSAGNAQPLKYMTIAGEQMKKDLYPHLRWAGALKDWDGPVEEERPAGYFVMVLDKSISENGDWDIGIVAQTVQLAAMELGIGSCMIGAFIKEPVAALMDLPQNMEAKLIIALGYPAEKREIVDLKDSSHYYRDADGVHYVPKRTKEELYIKSL